MSVDGAALDEASPGVRLCALRVCSRTPIPRGLSENVGSACVSWNFRRNPWPACAWTRTDNVPYVVDESSVGEGEHARKGVGISRPRI